MKALNPKLCFLLGLTLLVACALKAKTPYSLVDTMETTEWLGISPAKRFNLRT